MSSSEIYLIFQILSIWIANVLSFFFVAIGAHFFLKGDRCNPWKMGGLILAFGGVVVLFTRGMGPLTLETLPGDLMALGAGAFWGATTVYVKRYLTDRTVPLQTLFYQVFFSMPYLFLLSLFLEKPSLGALVTLSGAAAVSLFYQCIIVAFLSFLVWFELIHRHPVSLLHAFSFFTPVFGVFLSGVLILGEGISLKLMVALTLVSLGKVFINRRPGRYAASGE